MALIYLITVMKPAVPMLHYAVNYNYYATELCVNADMPELHCDGTCQLAMMLKEERPAPEKPVLPVFEGLDLYVAPFLGEDGLTIPADIDNCEYTHASVFLHGEEPAPESPPPKFVC